MASEEELDSFPYTEIIDGIEHNYRITQNHGKYGIERDGIVVAEVSHDTDWKQVSGEPLNLAVFESICDNIEGRYQ